MLFCMQYSHKYRTIPLFCSDFILELRSCRFNFKNLKKKNNKHKKQKQKQIFIAHLSCSFVSKKGKFVDKYM